MTKEELIKGLNAMGFDYDTMTVLYNNPKLTELYEKYVAAIKKLELNEQIIKEMTQETDYHLSRIERLEEQYFQESKQCEWLNQQLNEYEKLKNKYKTNFIEGFVDLKVNEAQVLKDNCVKFKTQLDNAKEQSAALKQELSDKEDKWAKWNRKDKAEYASAELARFKEELIKFLQKNEFYDSEWFEFYDQIDNRIEEIREKSNESR